MSSNIRTLLIATLLGVVCTVLLTGVSAGLQERQARNALIDRYSNLLRSVNLLDEGRDYRGSEIEALYQENIHRYWVNNQGELVPESMRGESDVPLYLYLRDNRIASYIVPINSRGLWGRIHGYLAIEKDGSTIAGFTVYKHVETPGLGGEIEKEWFRKNWVGKKIVDVAGNFVSITIAKGSVPPDLPATRRSHMVDGISGATMTGRFMTDDIRSILQNYEPVSIRFRGNRVAVPSDPTGSDNKKEGEAKR
ncbi:MAG: FMN-binding protein [Desulfuromonadaceae bacterium]|nr:FMN-binding protein [Desulfuromonadaceae bacterium]